MVKVVGGAEDVELGVVIAEKLREHRVRDAVQVPHLRLEGAPAKKALSSPGLPRINVPYNAAA